MRGLQASIIDVETAFLHGKLNEEIYMSTPIDMTIESNKLLRLKKTIYGLVQKAREFYKRFICELKDLGFLGNKSDPCLLSKRNRTGIMLIGVYVDDCLVLVKRKDIEIVDLKLKRFSFQVERSLKDYFSCQVFENIEKYEISILQPHLTNKLIEKFGNEVSDQSVYGIPGTP
jgi:Reverse transcriptase (RNA-dependent DNA polymerase)